tara:strand:+ start:145 stop:315 length:171 start_codon:yes stop_codon:yes gene_type:complete
MYIKKFQGPRTMQLPLWQFYESGRYASEIHQTLGGIEKGDGGERGAVLVYFIGRGI